MALRHVLRRCLETTRFHDGQEEIRLIEACVRAGAIDPVGGQRRPYVDGTDAGTNAALVDLLRSLVVLSQREVNINSYRRWWAQEHELTIVGRRDGAWA